MRALVIGATGATGKELVQLLIKDSFFSEVHLFVRKPLELKAEKVQTHVVDFNNPEQWKNLIKGDVAFSCLGTTLKAAGSKENQYKIDVNYQYNFAKNAKANGVEDFILISSYGADANSKVFYSRMKGELENKIKDLHFEKLTIFQPGMLDRKNSERVGEVIGGKVLKFFNSIGLFENQKPLPTKTLAQAMINASKIKSNGYSKIKLGSIFSFAEKQP